MSHVHVSQGQEQSQLLTGVSGVGVPGTDAPEAGAKQLLTGVPGPGVPVQVSQVQMPQKQVQSNSSQVSQGQVSQGRVQNFPQRPLSGTFPPPRQVSTRQVPGQRGASG